MPESANRITLRDSDANHWAAPCGWRLCLGRLPLCKSDHPRTVGLAGAAFAASPLRTRLAFAQGEPKKIEYWHRLSGDSATAIDAVAQQFNTEHAGLIERSREAQWRPCRLQAGPLKDANAWIERYRRFWDEGFDQMGDYIAELQARETPDDPDA